MDSEPLASAALDLSDQATITYAAILSAVPLAPLFASLVAAVWTGLGSYRRRGT